MTERHNTEVDSSRQEESEWFCRCPMCGGTVRANPGKKGPLWAYVCEGRCGGGRHLWEALQEEYGCSGMELWHGPLTSPQCGWIEGKPQSSRPPAPLPSPLAFRHYRRELQQRPDVLTWLADRGLPNVTQWRWGYGQPDKNRPPGIVIPCPPRRPITYRTRYWPELWTPPVSESSLKEPKPVKIASPYGHTVRLWPDMPRGGFVLLTEGEMDAAIAIQHGLRAVGTPGQMVAEELLAELSRAADQVAVCFDIGEAAEDAAERAVNAIRGARVGRDQVAAEAWSVRLPMPDEDDDLGDWFTKYNRTAKELRRLINQAKEK